MQHRACITTSLDDGHPLDLRLAGLLKKYGLQSTFYVPLRHDLPLLSGSWEIDAVGEWQNLERIFALMSGASRNAAIVRNGELAQLPPHRRTVSTDAETAGAH